mgnify:CR=1 FL=1
MIFYGQETENEENRKQSLLRTNSLRLLVNYVTRDMSLDMPLTCCNL